MEKQKPRVIKPDEAEHMRGHCGDVIRFISADEAKKGANANFDHVAIDYAAEHMHKRSTEYYYITKGEGCIYLNNEAHRVYTGCLVEIPPEVWHMAEDGLVALVIGIPPVAPDDIHYKDEKQCTKQ